MRRGGGGAGASFLQGQAEGSNIVGVKQSEVLPTVMNAFNHDGTSGYGKGDRDATSEDGRSKSDEDVVSRRAAFWERR